MPTKIYQTIVKAPVQAVWDFHNRPDAFKLLTPPDENVKVITKDMTLRLGAIHEFETKQFGLKIKWKAKLVEVTPPFRFVDVALRSPFKSWKHTHEFEDFEGETIIRDVIEYEAPGGVLKNLVDHLMVEDKIEHLLKHRHKVFHQFLESSKAVINEELFAQTELDPDSTLIS